MRKGEVFSNVYSTSEEVSYCDIPNIKQWLSRMVSLPVEMVSINSIEIGFTPRTDTHRNIEHIRLLAQSDTPFPPVIVHRATMRLIDGVHRLEATRLLKRDSIAARFFDGTDADAYALAVHANVAHGLPLSLAERKAAAVRLMDLHPQWSDRLIARTTGLSHHTVGAERRRVTGHDAQLHSRLGADGKLRPAIDAEGRRAAAEIVRDNPNASLRQVSRLVGVSPGTVRNIRDRLKHDEDPAPVRNTGSRAESGESGRDQAPDHTPARDDLGSRSAVSMPDPGSAIATSIQLIILQNLQNDPALRFSDRGRLLLRSVAAAINEIGVCDQALMESPSHCHVSLARLARANAQAWTDMAQRLEAAAENRPMKTGPR